MEESWRDIVSAALNQTEGAFRSNPANFSDERALTDHVRSQLVQSLGQVTVSTVAVEDGTSRGSIPDHIDYTRRYNDTTTIDCAHCEVGGPKFPFPDTHRMDLGLFDDGMTLRINGGTQEFDPSDLLAGFEFKYVKNINYLRHRPDMESSKYVDIATDISRLGELPQGVERWCVIFGNYGMLRRDDGQVADNLQALAAKHDVSLRFVLPEVE